MRAPFPAARICLRVALIAGKGGSRRARGRLQFRTSLRLTTVFGYRYVALHHALLAPNVACRLAAARICLRVALIAGKGGSRRARGRLQVLLELSGTDKAFSHFGC